MATKIITVEATPPSESTGADYNKGAPLNAAEFDQNIVNLRAAVDRKASLNNPTFTGTVTLPSTTSIGDVSATELQYLNSVTSNVQDQINSKAPINNPTFTGTVSLPGGTANGVLYLNGSKVATSGSALTFDGTNLGIGTASPSSKLTITGGHQNSVDVTTTNSAYDTFYKVYGKQAMGYYGGWSTTTLMLNAAGDFTSGVSIGSASYPSNLLVTGNLGIGVTPSAWGSSQRVLQMQGGSVWSYNTYNMAMVANVYQDGVSEKYVTTGAYATKYTQNAGWHYWSTAPSGTAGNAITYTQAMILDTSGNAYNKTGVWGTISSDIRYKENIIDATPKLADVCSLRVVNFNYSADESKTKCLGFIAQEMEQIFPALVNTTDNREYDEDGNVISGYEDSKGLKTGLDFAILVKAIQEQQAIIESLTQRIEALEYTKQGE